MGGLFKAAGKRQPLRNPPGENTRRGPGPAGVCPHAVLVQRTAGHPGGADREEARFRDRALRLHGAVPGL